MKPFIQSNFSGGINLFSADTDIADTEYVVGFNVRNRTNDLIPIKDAELDSSAPEGLKQGLYAFDKYLVLFCKGRAYYKNVINDSAWTQIADFAMSTSAPRIYAEAVPQSTRNSLRKLNEDGKINGTQLNTEISITPDIIPGTLGGLVCQDGDSQPWLISSDGTARKLKTYEQWSVGDREYVPVMKQMKFMNGILFGVAPDGITIYRSVTERPLDFVVNVDKNGNKGGDAKSTSYAVSPFTTTCLSALNSGQLFIGTLRTGHPIDFNYQSTIFAEPTFLNTKTFAAGVVNQFSFIDVIGDYTFIDTDGLRSFNAVNNDNNEGRQSVFSAKLIKALVNAQGKSIKQSQDDSCAVVFDNYSLYSIITNYGNVIAVYDNTRGVWVSLDQPTLDGPIRQFAVADQSEAPTVYAITENSVYKLYESATTATATIYFRADITETISVRLKCQTLSCSFEHGNSEVNATAGLIVDGRSEITLQEPLADNGYVDILTFNFTSTGYQGWKVQTRLSWQSAAILNMIQADYNLITSPVAITQAGKVYGN